MKRLRSLVLASMTALIAVTSSGLVPAVGQTSSATTALQAHVPGVVLLGFRAGVGPAARASAIRSVGATSSEPLSPLAPDAVKIHLGSMGVSQAVAALSSNPVVRYAEPDYIVEATATSDDPAYTGGTLWGMYGDLTSPTNQYGSQAGEAWAAGKTGSRDVYVGIIDTGIAYDHADLAANAGNPNEPIDGIDNDGNGVIDDRYGYDFVNNDRDPYDDNNHGTHVAGTIGGVGGNGKGVAGVNWSVGLLSGKFLSSSGSGSTSAAVLAVDYFTNLKKTTGLNIVATNNSWGGGGASQSLLDAINRGGDQGILFIAAAGNGGPDGLGDNNDSTANYPSNYRCTAGRDWDCVIAVAAITSSGNKAGFSNYGATTVDLGAPGSSIYSTVPGGYASYSGTSMATPHVAGAVALCASMGLSSPSAIRSALLGSATATSSMNSITVTGGRLNVGDMIAACGGPGGVYVAPTYTLTAAVAGAGSGYVTSSPAGISCGAGGRTSCTLTTSGTVTLTATPSTGSAFSSWTGCDSVSGNTCTVSMTQARSVTASFGLLSYSAKVTVSKPKSTSPSATIRTSGGTFWSTTCTSSCTATLTYGTVITVTAVTATGATAYTWTGCDSVSGNVCTVTVNGSEAITVTFKAATVAKLSR